MLTRAMSPVPAGRGSRVTPGGGPAMAAGPVSTAVGRLAVAAKVSAIGRECRNGYLRDRPRLAASQVKGRHQIPVIRETGHTRAPLTVRTLAWYRDRRR